MERDTTEGGVMCDYGLILGQIRSEISSTRCRVIQSANQELLLLYWSVGNIILEKAEWGSGFIPLLSKDICGEFPDMKGFSVRNLKYMRKFSGVVHSKQIVQTLSAQLSWSHVTLLLDKVKDLERWMWYAEQTGEFGWSVWVLDHQIATDLFSRQVTAKKISNFDRVLDSPQAKTVISAMKMPEDKPTIGLILCRDENSIVAEYALRDMSKPIGVSEYVFFQELPEYLREDLPDASVFGDRMVEEMEAAYHWRRGGD
ncbi:hypothetical protein McpSp1_17370 [Methanocorpusculaceae archaeon Sp1]|nr:hypothetical protein [Methanocorpusculaceae archaeon Sp1]